MLVIQLLLFSIWAVIITKYEDIPLRLRILGMNIHRAIIFVPIILVLLGAVLYIGFFK